MADLSWTHTTPLSRTLVTGRHGAEDGAAGVKLTEIRDFDLVQVMARRGRQQDMVEGCRQYFGAEPPAAPLTVRGGQTTLVWSGPDQFMALSPRPVSDTGVAGSSVEAARKAFDGKASVSDQSDGRALLRLSGPRARGMLAKVCSLDLHPSAFPVGAAAATSIDHTGVNLWRVDDEAGTSSTGSAAGNRPVYMLLVFATFAESLLGTILDSAAEYGVEVGTKNLADI